MPDEQKPVKVDVMCTKAKCENRNIVIQVTTYPHANVICGPCGSTLVADVPEPA